MILKLIKDFLLSTTNLNALKICLCFIAALFFTHYWLNISLFFKALSSTTTNFSWGDIAWIHQAFYNFVNDRPMQTSIYYYSGAGNIGNPYAYANQLAMHINFTPYIFSVFYKLFPGLSTVYAIVIFFNLIGFLGFFYLILNFYSKEQLILRYCFAVSVLFAGNFLTLCLHNWAVFPLYQGVFILAMFYAMLRESKWAFIAASVLFLLVSDDAALFAFSFGVFLYLYRPQEKFYSYFLMTSSVGYFLFTSFFLFPVVKFDINTSNLASSDTIIRLNNLFNGLYSHSYHEILVYFGFIVFIYAMAVIAMRRIPMEVFYKSLLFILIAPLSHWFITWATGGGGQHLMPVYTMIMLATLYMIGKWRIDKELKIETYRVLLIICGFLVVFVFNFNHSTKHYLGHQVDLAQRNSNEAVIKVLSDIPPQYSVVYWTNRGVDGFAVARNDVWKFPSYFDMADYLVIQKDATESFFEGDSLSGPARTWDGKKEDCEDSGGLNIGNPTDARLRHMLYCGHYFTSGGRNTKMDPGILEAITDELVGTNKTHVIEKDNENLFVLRRIISHKFPMPNSSIGFGWMENIPKYMSKIFHLNSAGN